MINVLRISLNTILNQTDTCCIGGWFAGDIATLKEC